MTSDMPLPRLIEGRAARPALCHGEYRQGIVYSLENRLGGGLEAGRWAFRRGQRRRVHPVGREKPVSYTHLTLPTTPYV